MAPSNLQGLNIVQPAPPQNSYLSDQDLLSVPPFPDLTAQLDLWTNLNFQSDEPLVSIDIVHTPFSSTVDSLETAVIDGKLVRVVTWYDNEWGFSNRMVDTATAMAKLG